MVVEGEVQQVNNCSSDEAMLHNVDSGGAAVNGFAFETFSGSLDPQNTTCCLVQV